MTVWNEVTSQDDLNMFMNQFGGFHDSCIKELKYISGAFVCKDLSMHPINSERVVKIIFQRQYDNPSVIEIEFGGVVKLSLFPMNEDYTCEITGATMILCNSLFYWCDSGGISATDLEGYEGTLICSKVVKWREADEFIGKKEVYKA